MYYPAEYVWRYNSKIQPEREFRSSELALAHDLQCAVKIVGAFSPDALKIAIGDAPPDLIAALELLADYAKSPTPISTDELPF